MSIAEPETTPETPDAPRQPEYRIDGLVAEYETPEQMLAAAAALRDAGYKRFETHSPFPVHGSDEAAGVRPTILPWLVLGAGLTGITIALLMIWWMNGVDYPFQISAKPLFALPPAMPITFELGVLFAATTAFLSVFALSNLPLFSNPLLRSRNFARATDDRFVVSVDGSDRLYAAETADVLRAHDPLAIEEMKTEKVSEPLLPIPMLVLGLIAGILSLVPFGVALKMRKTTSEEPRIHLVQDMDNQPRFNAQQASSVFEDGRAARPDVLGAVPRTSGDFDIAYHRGIKPGGELGDSDGGATDSDPGLNPSLDADDPELDADGSEQANDEATTAVPDQSGSEQTTGAAGGAGNDGTAADGGDGAAAPPEPDWFEGFPERFEISAATMERGQERYKIYCSPCHGLGGHGNGLVTQRAELIKSQTWTAPVSFHSAGVRTQANGRIYNTISNGIRKMPGYSAQIPVEDRWAIVLYLRALQKTQLGEASELDEQTRASLRMNK